MVIYQLLIRVKGYAVESVVLILFLFICMSPRYANVLCKLMPVVRAISASIMFRVYRVSDWSGEHVCMYVCRVLYIFIYSGIEVYIYIILQH